MRLWCQARDPVVCIGIGPFIRMRPQSQVELNAARCGFFTDEADSLEIEIPLGIRKTGSGHVVTRDGQQKRISEVEIGIGNVARTVVAYAERQIETIESMRCEHRKI